jgi:hypothetical protein
VARPNRAGTGWVQLGGVLNHDPTQLAFEPDLTESGSTPWITWSERDGQGGTQVRLARLVGNSFREVVGGGRAIGDGSSPQVVLYGGRPYVTYIDSTQNLRVVRPSRNMRTFEHVELGIGLPGSTNAKPLVSGGRLYVVYDTPGADPGTFDTRVGRLNSAGTRMEKISSSSRIGVYVIFYSQVAWARQVAYRSYGKDSFNGPGANRLLIVEAFLDDEWQAIPSPSTPGYDVQRSQLVGSDGTLWIIWDEGQAAMSPQRLVHVAKLVGTP